MFLSEEQNRFPLNIVIEWLPPLFYIHGTAFKYHAGSFGFPWSFMADTRGSSTLTTCTFFPILLLDTI